MRTLSLSIVALAVLTLVPATQAQQAAPVRQANIAAKAHQAAGMNHSRAQSFAKFKLWQKTVAFKTMRSHLKAKNVSHMTGKMHGANKNAGTMHGMNGANNMMQGAGKANANRFKANKASNVSLKAQFGKRYKIKQAVKTAFKQRQKAVMAGKAAMLANKQR